MNIGSMGGFRPPAMDSQAMKSKMQAGLEKLKGSNPDLAAKMEKIGARMEELKSSGADPMRAMESVKSEFGMPTDQELAEIQSAMGGQGGPGAKMFMVGNKDIQDLAGQLMDALSGSSDDEKSDQSSATQKSGSRSIQSMLSQYASQSAASFAESGRGGYSFTA